MIREMIGGANSMHRIRKAALILLTAGIAAGCGSSRPVRYFELEVPQTPPAAQAASAQFPVTLMVARVTSTHLYRDDRLVYGISGEELGTYEYARWAEPPVDMIQDGLIASLRSTRQFRSVSAVASNLRGDYLVRSHLEALDEIEKPQLAARFVMELDLYDPKSAATVWSDSYSHDEPVQGKKVEDVVAALDQNVKTGMNQLASDLGQYFASHPAQK
jgi:cholesterol transport system auxiliary component